jgi:hypothetical protein
MNEINVMRCKIIGIKSFRLAEVYNADGTQIPELQGRSFEGKCTKKTVYKVQIPDKLLEEMREYGILPGVDKTEIRLVLE